MVHTLGRPLVRGGGKRSFAAARRELNWIAKADIESRKLGTVLFRDITSGWQTFATDAFL